MKAQRDRLDAYVRAFKDATDGSIDMRATRARVLAAAGQRAHRRSTARRVLPIAIAGLVIGSSASAGVISLAARWPSPSSRPPPWPGPGAPPPAPPSSSLPRPLPPRRLIRRIPTPPSARRMRAHM